MSNRRNAFEVPPRVRQMPAKDAAPVTDRVKPSVSRDVAEIASHLHANPVFVDLFGLLRAEAVKTLCNSAVGEAGQQDREIARFELEALNNIEARLGALAAEMSLHAPADDHEAD